VNISVVTPFFNEEPGLSYYAEQISTLPGQHTWEFVLVDDGSTDGTATLLDELCQQIAHARLVRHSQNRGVGAAMRTGFQHATGDIVVCYDADCTYPVTDILTLARRIGDDADIVTASPYHSQGTTAIPFHRLLPSKALSLMYRAALRGRAQGITTFSCAFRAYKRPVLAAIDFQADGFLAASEILVRALQQGYRVVEVPSTLSNRKYGVSKMHFLPTVWSHLGLLSRLVWQDLVGREEV